ncbi:MAG: hypothetical protein ABH879_00635 [archaeon]
MGNAFLKGLGIGLILCAVSNYISMVPVIGSYLASYTTWVYLGAGIVLFYLSLGKT